MLARRYFTEMSCDMPKTEEVWQEINMLLVGFKFLFSIIINYRAPA